MSWRHLSLKDISKVIAGQSPKGKYYNSEGSGLPFYQGKKNFTQKFLGKPEKWTTKVTKEAFKGDILMSVRAPVGPVNIATEKVCIGRGLAAIRVNKDIDLYYVYNYLILNESKINGNEGAVFNSINKNQIESISIPIPPLSEQKQIVETLDKAFEKIDKAIANIERNIENAEELFQSKLDQIFSQIGEGWFENKLEEVTTKIGSGATPRGGKSSYKQTGVSLIRSMNVYDYGFKQKNLAFIDDEQAAKLNNVIVEQEDILLNITGASVARCCIIPKEYLPARVNQHVSIIRLNNKIIPSFVHYFLISNHNKKLLLGIGEKGGSTRQAITKSDIESFIVSYPSDKQKQKEIVNSLKTIRNRVLSITSNYNKELKDLAELKKSILEKAFKGELTSAA